MRNTLHRVTLIVTIIFLVGCSMLLSQPRLTPIARTVDEMTIEALEEFWEDYNVYFTGCCGGLQPLKGHPSAVMFDPKGDDKKLVGERWLKVESKHRLNELVTRIRTSERFESYYPALYQIIGPENELYGYMYTSWRHVVMKPMDEKTLYVFDLEAPPHLDRSVGGPGARP